MKINSNQVNFNLCYRLMKLKRIEILICIFLLLFRINTLFPSLIHNNTSKFNNIQ